MAGEEVSCVKKDSVSSGTRSTDISSVLKLSSSTSSDADICLGVGVGLGSTDGELATSVSMSRTDSTVIVGNTSKSSVRDASPDPGRVGPGSTRIELVVSNSTVSSVSSINDVLDTLNPLERMLKSMSVASIEFMSNVSTDGEGEVSAMEVSVSRRNRNRKG